jgi:hypothetical protein
MNEQGRRKYSPSGTSFAPSTSKNRRVPFTPMCMPLYTTQQDSHLGEHAPEGGVRERMVEHVGRGRIGDLELEAHVG